MQISLGPKCLFLLDKLLESGLYGATRADAAQRLIERGLEEYMLRLRALAPEESAPLALPAKGASYSGAPRGRRCAQEGCERRVGGANKSGFCWEHGADARKLVAKRAEVVARLDARRTCAFDEGCTTKIRDDNETGFCERHYKAMHMRKVRAEKRKKAPSAAAAVCGCGRPTTHGGRCKARRAREKAGEALPPARAASAPPARLEAPPAPTPKPAPRGAGKVVEVEKKADPHRNPYDNPKYRPELQGFSRSMARDRMQGVIDAREPLRPGALREEE